MDDIECLFNDIFKKYRWTPHIEIEVRFGWYDRFTGHFNANINEHFYNLILDKLNSCNKWDQNSTQTIVDYFTKDSVRISTDKKKKIINKCLKRKLETHDVLLYGTPYDIRISVCLETPIDNSKYNTFVYTRNKERNSFVYKMWSYDLTKVEIPINHFKDRFKDSNISHEFEIELRDINMDYDNAYISKSICMKIQDILEISDEKIHLRKAVLVK